MTVIVDSQELATFCASLKGAPVITVDTEFMRESTFWPSLCLVQVAGPETAACIDPLAEGMNLEPLFELLQDPDILKVFHAARQDLEIFHNLTGKVPAPIYDTQVAAMVCGFGEQASYEMLASQLAKAQIDKSSRFTDWSRRPLSEKQLRYALSDVTHLRTIFEKLHKRLTAAGREAWVADEMAELCDPRTYEQKPEDAWKRIKTRSHSPRMLAVLIEVAAWRESFAQTRNLPRSRVLRDEQLLEIAHHPPKSATELGQMRGLPRGFAEGRHGVDILAAVQRGLQRPVEDLPKIEREAPLPRGLGPLVDLLKVLLKLKCEEHDVAQKLIANSADLERIAADDEAKVAALSGWRRDVFGEAALALKHGRLALAAQDNRIRLVPLEPARPTIAAD